MYDVYVVSKDGTPLIFGDSIVIRIKGDRGLLDLIALTHMNSDQEIETELAGKLKGCRLYIWPHLEPMDLVYNKTKGELRRVKDVDFNVVYVWNTDDKYRAELQKNGYILHKGEMWSRDDIMRISSEGVHDIYYPNSKIGKCPSFDSMECESFETL